MISNLLNSMKNLSVGYENYSDEDSHYPDKVWKRKNYPKTVVKPLPLNTPIQPDKIRIVCISDTHSKTKSMKNEILHGDILIHAGDITMHGHMEELEEFCRFLAKLPKEQHKIVIAGNHDILLDSRYHRKGKDIELAKKMLREHCIYLEDSSVEICGLKIYGSPWQPRHCNNAFQLERGKLLLSKWEKIPDDTDILVTHGPPLGYGDLVYGYSHVGCVDLLNTVKQRVKPKYHIFGHIHEDYGMWTDGVTNFINASICASHYRPINDPIIIDVPKNLIDNQNKLST